MNAYSIFDDFGEEATHIIEQVGIRLTIRPSELPRPDDTEMKKILETYDCVIIGTSQKISTNMFEDITRPKIIGTASVGVDHIQIPEKKKHIITIINAPKANAQSVAEFTIGCALSCCKRLMEGSSLYMQGKNNKFLISRPQDLKDKIIGVIGAGNISMRIMEFAAFLDMKILCWTANPDKHSELEKNGIRFTSLDELVKTADVISVNLPNKEETKGIISSAMVDNMKDTAIFISVSRLATINLDALLKKAKEHPNFYVCIDIDVDTEVVNKIVKCHNVLITPHIGGGTVETRKRMFKEVAVHIADHFN